MLGASLASTTKAPAAQLPTSRAQNIQRLLNEAQYALTSGHLRDALIKLKLAASIDPNNATVLTRLGMAQLQDNDFANAEATLRRARQHGAPDELALSPLFEAMLALGENQTLLDLYPAPEPNDHSTLAANIWRARAVALQSLGDTKDAVDAINRALAIRRDYENLFTAAKFALLQQAWPRANALADEALTQSPNNTDALILKIAIALDAGEKARALGMAERLVAAKPNSMAARFMRIKLYLALGKNDLAKPDVDRILSVAPGTPIAMYYRAIILARQDNFSAAWATVHSLPIELIQTDPEMAINIANMATGAGYLESGATILNVTVSRNPNLLEARLELADVRLRQKSPEYALNVLAPVEDSEDPRVAVLLARANLQMGRGAKAQQEIDRAIELHGGEALVTLGKDLALKSLNDWLARHPSDDLVHRQYAILLLRFGDSANAKMNYEELVLRDPDDALAFNNLSWLVVNTDPARSLKLAQRAVSLAPTSPDYLDTLGCMQLRQKDAKGALSTLQQAHSLRSQDPGISYHLALALWANGAHASAKSLLSAAVAQGGFSDLANARRLLATWH
jgi:tetratricopeptide (TPR) repeat protein